MRLRLVIILRCSLTLRHPLSSQFVVLTPYQRQGHGCTFFDYIEFRIHLILHSAKLYKAIYQFTCRSPKIAELTVEDPAEAFEDLRDKNDLQMLLSNERFMNEGFGPSWHGTETETSRARKSGRANPESSSSSVSEVVGQGKLGPPADKVWGEKWRKDLKIAGVGRLRSAFLGLRSKQCFQRQFHRLIEMLILSRLDPMDQAKTRAYRLQVKERLYRFNFVSPTSAFCLSCILECCVRKSLHNLRNMRDTRSWKKLSVL